MIWNPNKECMSRDERSALQGKRLHKIVEYVYHNVPFYRNKLQEMDIRPDDIQTIEGLSLQRKTSETTIPLDCKLLHRARLSVFTLPAVPPVTLLL